MPPTLTLEQLVSLYAPLVGLIALSFWVGVLSQRVSEARARILALEKSNAERVDLKPELAGLMAGFVALKDAMSEFKNDTHEQFKELNHIIRNRLMVIPGGIKRD